MINVTSEQEKLTLKIEQIKQVLLEDYLDSDSQWIAVIQQERISFLEYQIEKITAIIAED